MTDPFVGQLAFFRVYSGHLDAGLRRLQLDQGHATSGSAASSRCTPTSARRSRKSAPATSRRPSACKNVTTGDTICDENNPIILEAMNFPEPVIAVAIEPKTKADQEKMGMALGEAHAGGPDLQGPHGQGDGPDHHPRDGRAAPRDHRGPHGPRVQRRRERRQAAGRLPRGDHAGGRGRTAGSSASRAAAASTATCKIRIEPAEEGHDFVFDNEIVGGAIPKEFIKPIEQGIKEAMETGILAGYPMTGVHVELYDGSYHDVDSSEMAFKIAGSMAFQDARQEGQADPQGADHGRRGRRARGLHGRRHRRPELAGAGRSSTWSRGPASRSSRRACRCRRCSVTRRTCAR